MRLINDAVDEVGIAFLFLAYNSGAFVLGLMNERGLVTKNERDELNSKKPQIKLLLEEGFLKNADASWASEAQLKC